MLTRVTILRYSISLLYFKNPNELSTVRTDIDT